MQKKYPQLETIRQEVLSAPTASADNYNCLLHLSGTRASVFQLYLIRNILGLRPLAVTFNHGAMDENEHFRLERAIEFFDVDHIRFNPRKSILRRFQQGERSTAITQFAHAAQAGMAWLSFFCARKYQIPHVILDSEMLSPFGHSPEAVGPLDQFHTLTQENIAFLADQLELASHQKMGLTKLDLKPYRFDCVGAEGLYVAKLQTGYASFTEAEREDFEKIFPWHSEAAIERRLPQQNDKKWHEREGRRPVTLELQPGRKPSPWEKLAEKSAEGQPLYNGTLQYCARCCMPETSEALAFDDMGMCQPCRSSEQKMRINWIEREKSLRGILESYKSADGSEYDLIVPISGGKDSTFQLYTLTQHYGLRPLAVTFSHNWYTETGKKNLVNSCDQFDVDHVIMTPRRKVINQLARKSLRMIGDSCWHCHSGVGAFPLVAASRFGIRLLVWGESVAERDGRATYEKPILFDRDYFTKISARFFPEQMVDEEISLFDVKPYLLPSAEELAERGVRGIHLGDYIFWDDERQTEFVRDFWGWIEDDVEGAYKGFKSVECRMAGVHDYSKFVKRGFGRGTDQASLDVRAGLMTREEGFDVAKHYDSERPAALDFYLEITGYTEEEFEQILKAKRDGNATKLP